MADPKLEPGVTSLIPSTTLTPLRIFLSLSILLVFLVVAFLSPRRRLESPVAVRAKKKGAKTVVLVGPLASGKTALFSRTHTSMRENEAVVKAKWGFGEEQVVEKGEKEEVEEPAAVALSTPLHLVDLPGHPRLRTRSLAQYLPAADGLIFTIDGVTGLTGKNVRDAGEHFHVVLSLLALLSSRRSRPLPPLLILLTKSDLSSSTSGGSTTSSPASKTKSPTLSIDRAKQSLLREIERRRLAASGGGGTSSGSSAPLSAGAKLEGLDAIPAGSSSSKGLVASLLTALGISSSSSSPVGSALPESTSGLPSDESEILSLPEADAFAFEGQADWDKLEQAVGVELRWATASVKTGRDGVERVYEWVDEL
ncbi:signal recognition particle receptor subunit beta [Rhodotorula toruloides]|uniref:Signal recognition particle receptor subunit beta n=1 Tax=Rhodotorula toruloides TaxID=5286 RepID=A0A511KMN2_RHOTO|nr:signal recognition particle receptor subunit beta [Rhodotorula toruloides]